MNYVGDLDVSERAAKMRAIERLPQQAGISSPAKATGVGREIEGLDTDLAKLMNLTQELRARMDDTLLPSAPTENLKSATEARGPGSPLAEGLAGFRYRARAITEIILDLHNRLDA